MFVLMMDIGVVRVAVRQRFVCVRMRVRLAPIPVEIVHMLVMGIVHMAMGMRDRFMSVHMLVAFGQVQPHPCAHQQRGEPEPR